MALRSVKPGERPGKKPASSVLAAVKSGDLREQFVAMRTRIATAIDDPNIRGADLAALSRRLHELSKEIAVLDASSSGEAESAAATPDEAWSAV